MHLLRHITLTLLILLAAAACGDLTEDKTLDPELDVADGGADAGDDILTGDSEVEADPIDADAEDVDLLDSQPPDDALSDVPEDEDVDPDAGADDPPTDADLVDDDADDDDDDADDDDADDDGADVIDDDAVDDDAVDPPQDCDTIIDGSALVESRADLAALAGVGHITGDLSIFATAALDLAPLRCLQEVGGDLRILGNPNLRSLSGLESLTRVGGDLEIGGYIDGRRADYLLEPQMECEDTIPVGNNALTSTAALGQLTSIGGDLSFQDNSALTRLDGLGGLQTIGGDLRLAHTSVQTITAETLAALTSIGGDLLILGNEQLTQIEGPANLRAIGGGLHIGGFIAERVFEDYCPIYGGNENDPRCERLLFFWWCYPGIPAGNPLLTTVDHFPALEEMGGDLVVLENPLLVSLDFEQLTTISGRLQVGGTIPRTECRLFDPVCWDVITPAGQPQLSALDGFPILRSVGALQVEANGIRSLRLPQLEVVERTLSIGGRYAYLELGRTVVTTYYVDVDNAEVEIVDLSALQRVGGDLSISGAGRWLQSLERLTSVSGSMRLAALSGALHGPTQLASIGGDLVIERNPDALDLSGFDALLSIGGDLRVGGAPEVLDSMCDALDSLGNPRLRALTGLPRLESLNGGVYLVDNALLSDAVTQSFVERLPDNAQPQVVCSTWTSSCPLSRTGFEHCAP